MIHVFSLALLILSSSVVAMDESPRLVSLDDVDLTGMTVAFPRNHVRSKCGVDLLLDQEGFMVKSGELVTRVQKHDTHPVLRKANIKTLAKYGAHNKFVVRNFDNGHYSVEPASELRGGGAIGAVIGSTLGYGLVTFVGHGCIQIAGICSGPAYYPVVASLEKMCAVPIHLAATKAGVAGGVIGGVATGPV